MTARSLMVVCLLGALNFNRDSSCAAVMKSTSYNFLAELESPSSRLRQLQMEQRRRLHDRYASQLAIKRQLAAAMNETNIADGGDEISNLDAAEYQEHEPQLTDDQMSQQALNNIMVAAKEVCRLVELKSASFDTFVDDNFPDFSSHLKMMIATAHANARIVKNTAAYVWEVIVNY